MHLNQFKEALKIANSLKFRLPNGQLIPEHFHITEVGESVKKFIDCGNTIREEKYIVFQLWHDQDTSHRLSPKKLLTIVEQSEKLLNLEDLEIRVEYQGATINVFKIASTENGSFKLNKTETACLAEDACGIQPQKKKIVLSYLKNSECTPNSGCC